ncbi:MAG: MgtC/SapB family protein, partial [Gammaproteobacteria bacterium]
MDAEVIKIDLFYRFGTALLIGLLVGLQREYAHFQQTQEEKIFGGARTFALLGLLGCTAAFLAERMASVMVFVAIIAVCGGLIIISYLASARKGSIGLTSEVAAVITMLAGAICFRGELAIAAALAVTMTVILALKLQTRMLARNITQADVYATLAFAVITLIILPLLPSR